jgi:hypothetical protein
MENEMPLLEGLAGETGDMGGDEMGGPEPAADPAAAAKEKLVEVERMATDAEAVAETIPAAKRPAAEVRSAADEIAGLIPAVEEAAKEYADAEPGSGAADAARDKLSEARVALDEPCERCKALYEEVMAMMPQMSGDGISEWADMALQAE